jgi:tyrosyl-tRNA synthetase
MCCETHLPVKVHVGHLVGQLLEVVWLEAAGVVDHVVVGGAYSALTHRLADQEEVVPAHNTKHNISFQH